MGVEGGMKCVRFLVFFFNFIFWLCGIALIVLGIYVQIALNDTLKITNWSSSGAPIVILIVGVIIFFVSFFGCCGAWKENYCMVTTFAVLLTLIFLVEIAAAIAGYIFRDKIQEGFKDQFRAMMHDFKTNKTAEELNELQKQYSCCGATNYTDWFNVTEFSDHTVPRSCCRDSKEDCTKNPTSSNVFNVGCATELEEMMKKHILIIAGVALGIAFFELLGIIFACCLMKGIRSGYEVM